MKGLEILKKVAVGSAVDAYLARTSRGQVMVQLSHPSVAADPEIYGRFLDTTRVTATQHKHPALLTVEQTRCEPDGSFVLITGPLSGRTAVDHLREQGPLGTEMAKKWAVRLCDAIEFLHAHQVIHGHLAPKNLFLDGDPKDPDVRLLDTALLLFRGTKSLPITEVLVSPEYLSPERCAGQRATVRCDVYGMGVLLFELLTGRPPFVGRDRGSSLPGLIPGLEEWQPVLSRCLAIEPTERFPSMAALRDAIKRLAPLQTPAIDIELSEVAPLPFGAGTVLGRYRLEKLLGEGGMGQVYEASHLSLQRTVAIKVLRTELSGVDSQVQRFLAEAQAVSRAKHPHIVAIEDLVHENGRVYFVMERLQGPTLKALAKDAPLELKRVLRLMAQAASALASAHSVGVIHRDVKPENMVVERAANGSEVLKVLDFGVARVRGADPQQLYKTQVGQVVGTPLWMAPEQVLGQEVDSRADVYALSMVLYVLLTRRFPFSGGDLSNVVLQRLSREADAVGANTFLGEQVPPRLQRLVQMGLARDREHRPATMEWMEHELRGVLADLEVPGEIQSPRKPWWNRWRS